MTRNDLVIREQGQLIEHSDMMPVSAQELATRRETVKEIMHSVLEEGVHYGLIPYTDKKTLLKPGAEVLLNTFMIGINPHIEDISPPGELAYRCITEGIHLQTNKIIGRGLGEASSLEEKYAWRKAVNRDEWEFFPERSRRVKFWQANNGKSGRLLQVRQDPQSLGNTLAKMAKKRAMVDLCRTALGVSDLFVDPMDTDDRPPSKPASPPPSANAHRAQSDSYEEAAARHARPRQNTPEGGADGPPQLIQPNQQRIIRNSLNSCGVEEAELLAQFGINALEALPFAQINDALEWIRSHVNGGGNGT